MKVTSYASQETSTVLLFDAHAIHGALVAALRPLGLLHDRCAHRYAMWSKNLMGAVV